MSKTILPGLVIFLIGPFAMAQTLQKPDAAKPVFNFVEGLQLMQLANKGNNTILRKGTPDTTTSLFKENIADNLRRTLGLALETFMPFQFKYAILLNESVEKISNLMLYKTIDDWYGTRYRYGGTTNRGIDCSAFMQVLSGYAFGWMLPRTAREQYRSMKAIPRSELQEGDFVFFNTRGGISHVGMYLQNNKFVHSSSSKGVNIGDLSDSYWSPRFIGAKRVTYRN